MIRLSPTSTRTDTAFPYTTLCRADDRVAAGRSPMIKRFVGPILFYRLIKSGSRRDHAARIDNGCLIARKARHRDEQLGDMHRPHDPETTARRTEIEEPFLQRGRLLARRTACQKLGRESGGKACRSTCRSRGAPPHSKKHKKKCTSRK